MHGLRSYSKKIKEDPNLPKPWAKSPTQAMVWGFSLCVQRDDQIFARTWN
jgi:hypothetical protein